MSDERPRVHIQTNYLQGTVKVYHRDGDAVEFQVVPEKTIQGIRAGLLSHMTDIHLTEAFAHELVALLDKYGAPHFDVETLT